MSAEQPNASNSAPLVDLRRAMRPAPQLVTAVPASRQWRGCCASALHPKRPCCRASVPKICALACNSALVAISAAQRAAEAVARPLQAARRESMAVQARLIARTARSRSGDARAAGMATTQHKALWRAKTTMAMSKPKSRPQLAAKDTSKWDESSHMRDERIVHYLVLSTCATSGWWAS